MRLGFRESVVNIAHILALGPAHFAAVRKGRVHVRKSAGNRGVRRAAYATTEGKFNWYYDFDETIMILEGSIVLESEGMPPRRYGVGDVIFFRDGAHAKSHVEGYVKKVAFCRQTNPFWLGFSPSGLVADNVSCRLGDFAREVGDVAPPSQNSSFA
jgi:uncharacterized cupin superfamily protein